MVSPGVESVDKASTSQHASCEVITLQIPEKISGTTLRTSTHQQHSYELK